MIFGAHHNHFIPGIVFPWPSCQWTTNFNIISNLLGMNPSTDLAMRVFFDPELHSAVMADAI
jgi:hypothetical protein